MHYLFHVTGLPLQSESSLFATRLRHDNRGSGSHSCKHTDGGRNSQQVASLLACCYC